MNFPFNRAKTEEIDALKLFAQYTSGEQQSSKGIFMSDEDFVRLSPSDKALTALAGLSYRTGELSSYLQSICQSVLDVLGDGAAAITLYRNNEKKVLARVPMTASVGKTMDVHGHLSTYVVENRASLRVDDAIANPEYGNPPQGFCSYLGIPLKLPSGEIVGTLCYFDKNARQYTDSNEQVAELFAERIAVALDNFELYQQLKEHSVTLEQMVEERTQDLMAAQDALFQKEKLAAIGEFATLMTHEIRNPLATIRLALEYVEKMQDTRAVRRATLAASEVSRVERMLNEVLIYAKPTALTTRTVDLVKFVEDFLGTNESILQQKQQQCTIDISANPVINADPDKLHQIFLNLMRNASEAAEDKSVIVCTIGELNGRVFFSMQNGGAVIPVKKLLNITEAFVSGKPNGTGLGLAIVESLVKAHNAELDICSSVEKGTTVTIYFSESC